ncbi:MAG: class I SAM-dependent methyltransferase [Phycisphaerales bacterium]|nr:class I SAM-dependent methyltransferase [Phycisphaerales bacterium]
MGSVAADRGCRPPLTPRFPPGEAVAETALITLWARAEETHRPDALLRDPMAVALCERLAYDFARFRGGWKSQVGVAVRGRYIDERVADFMARHPGGQVVNLGAGLDTRFHRLDDGRVRWIDVDLPAMIALRAHLLPAAERVTTHGASLLCSGWIDRVVPDVDRPTLFVAEGVLMFLPRRRVQALLAEIATTCVAAEVIFDAIGPLMVRCPWLHDTLPRTTTRFAWGFRTSADLTRLAAPVRDLVIRAMLDETPTRWRWMRWLRPIPALRHQFVVAHGRLGER